LTQTRYATTADTTYTRVHGTTQGKTTHAQRLQDGLTETIRDAPRPAPARAIKECRETFGGPNDDVGSSIIETSDGGYAIVGSTKSYGAGKKDLWLVKTDENCQVEWNQTYGGAEDDEGDAVIESSDRGYVITGYTESYGNGGKDLWLLKVSESGSVELNKTYGNQYNEQGYDVLELSDGYLILAGNEKSGLIGSGDYDLWLVKTDRTGTKIGDNTIGGRAQTMDTH